MPVPTHREDCKTRIWRTTCPDCDEAVYFFSCSCGSRVFFDLNKPPWNPHEERCIPYLIRYLREVKHMSANEILKIIQEYAITRDLEIPLDIRNKLQAQSQRESGRIVIVKILPEDTDLKVLGNVISTNLQVNFCKRLNYTDSVIGRKMLGRLLEESFAEIVIREDADEEIKISGEFTVFVPLDLFQRSGVRQNMRALLNITPHDIPGRTSIWLAKSIDRI